MQALSHVAQRLHVLHAAGWTHRDLKPGNVLRRPQHHSWTLIDFGCTVRTGACAQHTFAASICDSCQLHSVSASGHCRCRAKCVVDIDAVLLNVLLVHSSLHSPAIEKDNLVERRVEQSSARSVGEVAPLTFSPGYAPPEVIHAYRAGRRTIVADSAVDMWALGVIAYEMLTQQRAFGPQASVEETISRTAGEALLPWEEPSRAAQAKLRELRGLKRMVMLCLDRNPAQRPTSEHVLQSWNQLFDSTRPSTVPSCDSASTGVKQWA
jgi:serine/threonine protein kinase